MADEKIDIPESPPMVTLKTRVGTYGDDVVIMFEHKIDWLCLTPEAAREFATGILEAAGKVRALN